MLLIVQKIYRIDFIKYLSLLLFIVGVVVSPLIAMPHISIYQQDKFRREFVAKNRKNKNKAIFVPRLIILSAPTENWGIVYYDILWPCFEQQLNKEFGGKISFEVPVDLYLRAIIPANWNKDN